MPTISSRADLDGAVSRLTEEIKSATDKGSKFRASTPRRTTDHVLQQIREKNRFRNRWHRSRDPALKTQINRLQRSIKSACFDAEHSSFDDYIAEAEKHPANA